MHPSHGLRPLQLQQLCRRLCLKGRRNLVRRAATRCTALQRAVDEHVLESFVDIVGAKRNLYLLSEVHQWHHLLYH